MRASVLKPKNVAAQSRMSEILEGAVKVLGLLLLPVLLFSASRKKTHLQTSDREQKLAEIIKCMKRLSRQTQFAL